jgi:hypothetical protein
MKKSEEMRKLIAEGVRRAAQNGGYTDARRRAIGKSNSLALKGYKQDPFHLARRREAWLKAHSGRTWVGKLLTSLGTINEPKKIHPE